MRCRDVPQDRASIPLVSGKENTSEHPLVTSCVFDYEFEFNHPFADGNGWMGRLWQTLILHKWKPPAGLPAGGDGDPGAAGGLLSSTYGSRPAGRRHSLYRVHAEHILAGSSEKGLSDEVLPE